MRTIPLLKCFTCVQNETSFLRKWSSYYGQHLAPDDLYVLDHDSQGETVDLLQRLASLGVNVFRIHNPYSYDSQWLVRVVRSFQQFLLSTAQWVLFCGVDEIVVPASDTSLLDFFRKPMEPSILRCRGYEVLHFREEEPPLVLSEPWLRQRSRWYHCARYSKPTVARLPVFWTAGFHEASNVEPYPANAGELLLIHLHRIDYDECLARHRERAAREWAPRERREGVYRQNLLEDPEKLSRWMLCNADKTSQYAVPEQIPSPIRDLL
jgi:hypothetical protein